VLVVVERMGTDTIRMILAFPNLVVEVHEESALEALMGGSRLVDQFGQP